MSSLSLVVPVHNGEKFIESSLRDYNEHFSGIFDSFEMIIVCNSCTDNTYAKCLSLQNELPIVVINTSKKGKGYAVVTGFELAKHDILGFIDADNPFKLDEVLKMMDHLKSFDMVIVTKFKKLSKYQTSVTRRFFSISGAIFFRLIFGLNFKDTQAGAKFLKRDLWKKLKKPFVSKGFEFDMELLYKASKKNARIKEYYIPPRETDFSTVKARILPGMLYRLLKLRLLK